MTLPTRRENHTEPSSGVRGTVLLADDDAVILELASRVLSKEGFNVLAACDGEEALRLFERNGEAIRLAVLDDVMPKASGRMVIERIRSARPSLPVILCTAYEWGVQESAARRRAGDPFQALRPPRAREVRLTHARQRCVRTWEWMRD